jgi:hypothetical protein
MVLAYPPSRRQAAGWFLSGTACEARILARCLCWLPENPGESLAGESRFGSTVVGSAKEPLQSNQ